ncbi:DegT/DnrJ/EryC1/StrS family aminotransferase, partial [Anaerolineales bacterium HSG24]|nr:DegT/DnrJ/EryC1/StrS family aminotransferase [Anaerolineales bacterium HSG24]
IADIFYMVNNQTLIPVAEPVIGDKELAYITDCLKTGWISSIGQYVTAFENRFAEYCHTKYGVATFNGTVALHLLAAALNLGPGDEVIMPSLTFVATANAIQYTGATPVFVDSEYETWNIDPAVVASAITPRTKAIIAVHLYGHPADMDPLREIAQTHNLLLLEDAAEAHGACYKGQRVGGLSDAAIFSFYGNKIMTTGEGGIIVTNNQELSERAFFLENQGRYSDNPYWHSEVAFNYRMTNMQAAVGVAQLERIDDLIALRQRNAAYYNQRLAEIDGLTLPPNQAWAENVYWMYSILLDDALKLNRDEVRQQLRAANIDTRPFFYSVHQLPMYDTKQSLPVAEYLSRRGINLPSGAPLTVTQIDRVCDTLIKILA